MALRERFEAIYDSEYLPYSYVFEKDREANIQELLDAVCADGHTFRQSLKNPMQAKCLICGREARIKGNCPAAICLRATSFSIEVEDDT